MKRRPFFWKNGSPKGIKNLPEMLPVRLQAGSHRAFSETACLAAVGTLDDDDDLFLVAEFGPLGR